MAKSFFERLTGSRSLPPPEPPRERLAPVQKNGTAAKPKFEDSSAKPEAPEDEGELMVDIFDDGDNIVIQAIVGGVRDEDLDVQVTDDAVTIKGSRERHQEIEERNFYYRELYWGSFTRSIILPQEIISDEADATVKKGLLTVKLPKRDRNRSQKVRVKSD